MPSERPANKRAPPIASISFSLARPKRGSVRLVAWVTRWGHSAKKSFAEPEEARAILEEFIERALEVEEARLIQDLAYLRQERAV